MSNEEILNEFENEMDNIAQSALSTLEEIGRITTDDNVKKLINDYKNNLRIKTANLFELANKFNYQ